MRSFGISKYDIDILLEAIRAETMRNNCDIEFFTELSENLKKIRDIMDENLLISLYPQWVEPLVDALESKALIDFDNVLFYGTLAAHLRHSKLSS